MISLLFSLVAASAVSHSAPILYTVPVKPGLARYATFELASGAFAHDAEGRLTVDFDLPEDLVGKKPVHIALAQTAATADQVILEGELGHAVCALAGGKTSCRIEYRMRRPYTFGVVRLLMRKYLAKHLIKRISVALAFSSDPVGILEF